MYEEIETNDNSNVRYNNACKWTLILIGIVLLILLFLYLLRKFFKGPHYKKKNRIDGKIVIITGCNTGIGKETALELAKRGGKIYMACRNYELCENARQEIITLSGNKNVFNRTLDLASLQSIRNFANGFLSEESQLDILINNAGVGFPKRSITSDGFEIHMGINHLGHFLLTNLLLNALKSTESARIINVTSGLYWWGRIRKDDFMYENHYNGLLAYCNSKLANILFTVILSERLKNTNVTVNCVHPGVVRTDITRNYISSRLRRLTEFMLFMFMKNAKDGAQTSIRTALDPALNNVTGKYYVDCYLRLPLLPHARNRETGEWLWNKSEELTHLNKVTNNRDTVLTIEEKN